MCGIVGFLDENISDQVKIKSINNMLDNIQHRGPDESKYSYHTKSNLILGHSRLTILDLMETGSQPMLSSCGEYEIVFNGEIYNYIELKRFLRKKNKNLKFRGSSDTEVLLEYISFFGIKEALHKAKGMFALCVYSKSKNILYLARDICGEKPLYFHCNQEMRRFFFSSELKPLRFFNNFKKEIDMHSLWNYLSYGNTPSNNSIFCDVKKIQPGEIMELNLNNFEIKREYFWTLPDSKKKNTNKKMTDDNVLRRAEDLLLSSVEKQMRSDVPVGAFLSGGIDSTLIVSVMKDLSDIPVETFSIGLESKKYDESQYAKSAASYLNTSHNEIIVTHDDLLETFTDFYNIYDEPFSDSSGIVTKIVSDYAVKKVKVALTGDGGDEIFGGYNRHKVIAQYWPYLKKIPPVVRMYFSKLLNLIGPKITLKIIDSWYPGMRLPLLKWTKLLQILEVRDLEDYYEKLNRDWPLGSLNKNFEKYEITIADKLNKKFDTDLSNIMYWDLNNYLPNDILTKVDRASMSCSLETRAPFLDKDIIEFAFTLPDRFKIRNSNGIYETKWILRRLLEKRVPKKIFERPKTGFSIPIDEWLKGPLKNWAKSLLTEENLNELKLISYTEVQKKWDQHQSGKYDWSPQLWNVLVLVSWIKNEKRGSILEF